MSFKNILVATDLSEESYGVDAFALSLANAYNANITYCYVDDFGIQFSKYWMYAELGAAAKNVMARENEVSAIKKESLESRVTKISGHAHPRVSSQLLTGDPVSSILNFVHPKDSQRSGGELSRRFDLLILGKKQRGALQEFLLGATALHLVDDVKIPTLILPAQSQIPEFKKVLLASSMGQGAERALSAASDFLTPLHPNSVHLLHVIQDRLDYFPFLLVENTKEQPANDFYLLYDLIDSTAQRNLDIQSKEFFKKHDIPSYSQIVYGNTTEQLLLESKKYDLTILGTHAEKNFVSSILGSTARTFVTKSNTSTLVIPHSSAAT